MPARLVMLNGVSSSGKTTLATAFRDARADVGDFWMLVGIDDALSKLPAAWIDLGLPGGPGTFAKDGMWFEPTADGPRLRVGSLCRRLLEAYQRSVADAVRSGLNVIVDDVVVDAEMLDGWTRALAGLDPTWVAIDCAPEITRRREHERGDRARGMADAQHATIHDRVPYSFRIDTGVLGPADALAALQRALDTR